MLYILIILVIFLIDDKIKHYIEENKEMHKKEVILKNTIIVERYHNKGAMLSFMEKNSRMVKYISATLLGIIFLVFALILPKKNNHILKLSLSLVIGGALSNVYDRIKKGYVVDYFSFNFKGLKKIIFNLSDICIIIGSVIIAILSFRKDGLSK